MAKTSTSTETITQEKTIIIKGQPIPAKRVTRHTLWMAKAYSDYKDYVAWELKRILRPKQPIKNDITIKRLAFYRETNRRADIDNLLKAIMESLALCGYIANDKQVVCIEKMTVEHGSLDPRIELEL